MAASDDALGGSRPDRGRLWTMLERGALFRDAPPDVVDQLALQFRPLEVAAGDVIIRQGDTGGELFLVETGELEATVSLRGKRVRLELLRPGDVFGEMTLRGTRRTATVTALRPVRLWSLSGVALREATARAPRLAANLRAIMRRRGLANDLADLPSGVVTFLVADLRGSSELWERHPRAMPGALARFQSIVQDAVESHQGRVFQVVGDTALAAFATVRDGVAAAIAAQRALRAEPWGIASPIGVATALHTDTATPRDGQYFGSPIVHLVKVAGLAHGGQILLSRATAELVLTRTAAERVRETLPNGVSLRDMGEERLQGVRRPDRIFQLVVPGLPDDFPVLRTPANRLRELTRTVQELRALEEFSRVIGSTLDLQQVYAAIVAHATELTATDGWAFFESDGAGREFHVRAAHEMPEELLDAVCKPWGAGQANLLAQAALLRRPVHIADIFDEPDFVTHSGPARSVGKTPSFKARLETRSDLARLESRALLAVPLVREDSVLGVLVARRKLPGRFQAETVDLVQAFAAQSVLAIQNARLFQQVEEKSRQLEIADRHKSEFLTNMSHELRTPLNAIIGFSEVLLERMFGDLNEKQGEYLQDILTSGRHLLSLINDILDLSKVEAGRMELDLGTVSLPDALEHGLTMVREQATRHDIALSLAIAPTVRVIEADERKLKQVLFNLLSNAVKFTPDGGRVEITADQTNGEVELAVRDSGIGIAPDNQERIFDEFHQAGTGHREGTGLGLTLAKKLVELHGGRITVASRLGEGSTFIVTLPLRQRQSLTEPATV